MQDPVSFVQQSGMRVAFVGLGTVDVSQIQGQMCLDSA